MKLQCDTNTFYLWPKYHEDENFHLNSNNIIFSFVNYLNYFV